MEHQDHAECAENAERVEHVECPEYTGVQRSAVGRRGAPRSTVETVKNLKYAVYSLFTNKVLPNIRIIVQQ